MTFFARKGFLPIVIVVVTPAVITREPVIASLRTGTAARTVPYDPSFPPSPFYLYESEERVSARRIERRGEGTNELGIN